MKPIKSMKYIFPASLLPWAVILAPICIPLALAALACQFVGVLMVIYFNAFGRIK